MERRLWYWTLELVATDGIPTSIFGQSLATALEQLVMSVRPQRTIVRPAQVCGTGLFSGLDVCVRFFPAPPGYGIQFLRTDLPGARPIPALIEYAVSRDRRTGISLGTATVEMTEHVLAALAGLWIDNCLVEVNTHELPGLDGSALPYCEALLSAGIVDQSLPRTSLVISKKISVSTPDGSQWIEVRPSPDGVLSIGYGLDYGLNSPIVRQYYANTIRPDCFVREIAPARTFVLEREVQALRDAGYGKRTTAADLLVFGEHGPIGNSLRSPNECARHKLLDCVGDLALLGCDLIGQVEAFRSGHQLNAELARKISEIHGRTWIFPVRVAA